MTEDDARLATREESQPVSSLAKRVIERRLAKVVRLLPRAAKHPERDVEYVHDLRVADTQGDRDAPDVRALPAGSPRARG